MNLNLPSRKRNLPISVHDENDSIVKSSEKKSTEANYFIDEMPEAPVVNTLGSVHLRSDITDDDGIALKTNTSPSISSGLMSDSRGRSSLSGKSQKADCKPVGDIFQSFQVKNSSQKASIFKGAHIGTLLDEFDED